MNFATWVQLSPGRVVAVARHFGVTHGAVSQWAENGVPLLKMRAVRDFTSNAVTLEEMVPQSPGPFYTPGPWREPSERDEPAAAT